MDVEKSKVENNELMIISTFDITNRKHLEEKYFEGEQKKIFREQNPTAYIHFDTKSNITIWNQSAEHIFGHSRLDVIGKNSLHLLITQAFIDEITPQFNQLIKSGSKLKSNLFNRTLNSNIITCSWNSITVKNKQGEVTCWPL